MKVRDKSLDAVKGFAIILVMLGHCIVKNNMVDAAEDPYIYDLIKTVEMPLFIMISGYLAGLSVKPSSIKIAVERLKKRAISYLVPFFVWILLSNLFSGKIRPLKAVVDVLFHLDWGLWFLMTLFIVTIVVTLADCFREWWKFLAVVLVAYIFFYIQSGSGNTFLSPHLTIRYMPYYLAGFFVTRYIIPLSKAGNKMISIITQKAVLWIFWAFCFAGYLYFVIAFDMVTVHNTMELLVQMIASFMGCYVCFFGIYQFYNNKIVFWDYRDTIHMERVPFLSKIGQYTLEIYVLHFRFVTILGFYKMGYKLCSKEGLLVVAASFIVMSVLSWLVIVLVKKVPALDFLLFGKTITKRKK